MRQGESRAQGMMGAGAQLGRAGFDSCVTLGKPLNLSEPISSTVVWGW